MYPLNRHAAYIRFFRKSDQYRNRLVTPLPVMIKYKLDNAINNRDKMDVTTLIINAGPVVKLILAVLCLLSVACWGIIFLKWKQFNRLLRESRMFLNIFWEEKRLDAVSAEVRNYENSPAAKVFRAGYMELMKAAREPKAAGSPFTVGRLEMIERALRRAESTETALLERHLGFLATTGSAAPFIGLFGTVWGIMNSFQRIGTVGTANLAVVAPGVSEALIATAIGLAAAIPAVIFYNVFTEKLKRLTQDIESLILEFLNIAQRGLRKHYGESS